MMAAAQMHKEGRLVKPVAPPTTVQRNFDMMDPGMSPAKMGAEEWDTVRRPHDYGESMQGEGTTDTIMRKLSINKGMAKLGYNI